MGIKILLPFVSRKKRFEIPESGGFYSGNDRTHDSAVVMNEWMHLAHSKCSISVSSCYHMLLYVSLIMRWSRMIHTRLLTLVTLAEVKLEGDWRGMKKKMEIKRYWEPKKIYKWQSILSLGNCKWNNNKMLLHIYQVAKNPKYWQHEMLGRMQSNKNSCFLLMGCKMVQSLWETVWEFLIQLNIFLICSPAIALLGIYLSWKLTST